MFLIDSITPDWAGKACIVAASGPSLTEAVAQDCMASGLPCIVVNDAHKMIPSANILYAADAHWWNTYDGVFSFKGERWSTLQQAPIAKVEEKVACARRWHLKLVRGRFQTGFSFDPRFIHFGSEKFGNSGFQAINIALLLGCTTIILVGYNMSASGGKLHFFGQHPAGMKNLDPRVFIPQFNSGAKTLPADRRIINCTEATALKCFPTRPLKETLDACVDKPA